MAPASPTYYAQNTLATELNLTRSTVSAARKLNASNSSSSSVCTDRIQGRQFMNNNDRFCPLWSMYQYRMPVNGAVPPPRPPVPILALCVACAVSNRASYTIDIVIMQRRLLHCALASGAVYCNRSCLCVCGGRAGGRCLLP